MKALPLDVGQMAEGHFENVARAVQRFMRENNFPFSEARFKDVRSVLVLHGPIAEAQRFLQAGLEGR